MNIVILDQLAFTPQQLARLRKLGPVQAYHDYPDAQTAVQRLEAADIAIVGWTTLNRQSLKQLPRLRLIALAQTGTEIIDLHTAEEQHMTVTSVHGYSRQSVAEYAFALALAAGRHIIEADREVRSGNVVNPTVAMLGLEFYNKTLGILGLGDIGIWMGRIGQGFGMRVIGHSRNPKHIPGIADVTLDELLVQSDILMIALDTNPSTVGLLNAKRLRTIKPGALLVNITSNQVLDEAALAELLTSGRIRAAAFDDLSHLGHDDTRRDSKNPLVDLPNVVLSPQAGWYTLEAQERLLEMTVGNVEQFTHSRIEG